MPPDNESYDCIDEILSLFRANVLFRNFEVNGPADRMLIYGTLFISECLGKVKPNMNAREAEKVGVMKDLLRLEWGSYLTLTGSDQCLARPFRYSR